MASKDPPANLSKFKAVIAFLPYAVRQEDNGIGKPLNIPLHTARFSQPHPIIFFKLAAVVLPVSFHYVTLHAFRYKYSLLRHAIDIPAMMQLWMGVVSALPYSDDIVRAVADAVLGMASIKELSPHIPLHSWGWLNKRPVLPRGSPGLLHGNSRTVIRVVRELRDVNLTVSYLLIVWSEWGHLQPDVFLAMRRLIREELSGIGLAGYRVDLIERLKYVVFRISQGWNIHPIDNDSSDNLAERMMQYEELKRDLLAVDKNAAKILTILTSMSSVVTLFSVC